MIGLAYKDLLVQRKTLLWYLMFCVIYTVMCASGIMTISILGGFAAMAGFLIPINSIAYDDQVKWDMYAAAAPGGRREIVGGKYLFSLFMTVVGSLLALAASLLLYTLGLTKETPQELVLIVLACAGAGIFLNCILLPLMLKFGAEKGRIIMMAAFVAVFASCAALAGIAKNKIALPTPPAWLWNALPVFLTLLLAAIMAASIGISLHIYEKKEF